VQTAVVWSRSTPHRNRGLLHREQTSRSRPSSSAFLGTLAADKLGRKTKLTSHQQQEARERIAAGETQRSVAPSYNVSQATISRLR
jgi:hypothetical protein